MIELDTIYNCDCLAGMKQIPDGTVDCIISDPPYFKVVGEKWDYAWRTENDYIKFSVEWLKQSARCLRLGGTLYCFGYFRILSLIMPYIRDMGFELRQQIVINKGMKAVSGRATRKYKQFPNVTESILFLIKDNKKFIKPFLKERQAALGLSAKEINERIGVKSNGGGMWSIYTGKNVCEQFPTRELWDRLAEILQFNIPYASIAQTFNPQMGYTDVWDDIDFREDDRVHPTQKPVRLIERLVKASTNPNDIILDPFIGSGTTAIACIKERRHFIGYELSKEYFDKAIKRIENEQAQLKLF